MVSFALIAILQIPSTPVMLVEPDWQSLKGKDVYYSVVKTVKAKTFGGSQVTETYGYVCRDRIQDYDSVQGRIRISHWSNAAATEPDSTKWDYRPFYYLSEVNGMDRFLDASGDLSKYDTLAFVSVMNNKERREFPHSSPCFASTAPAGSTWRVDDKVKGLFGGTDIRGWVELVLDKAPTVIDGIPCLGLTFSACMDAQYRPQPRAGVVFKFPGRLYYRPDGFLQKASATYEGDIVKAENEGYLPVIEGEDPYATGTITCSITWMSESAFVKWKKQIGAAQRN